MADYTWAVDMAEELIREYGREGTLVVFQTLPGDKPWDEGTVTEQLYPCRVVFTRYKQEYIDGTLIHQQDRIALVAAKGMGTFDPNLKGEIRIPGKAWKIVSVDQIQPAEQTILYRFQARL